MKIEKEKKIVALMISMYSQGVDKKKLEDNEECLNLLRYAELRLSKCPFKDNKKFCSHCKIHCYQKEYREKMKKVMRYAGPRMLFKHPILLFKHFFERSN